jgi:hypothetical protein
LGPDGEPVPPPPERLLGSPPECELHPLAEQEAASERRRVVRAGRYASSTPLPRQRYRCVRVELDEDGNPRRDENGEPVVHRHVFTPPLPRAHVHPHEDGCAECEEHRGLHHGETAVARRHSWPTFIVARALRDLSLGSSYGEVGRSALRAAQLSTDRFAELVAREAKGPSPSGRDTRQATKRPPAGVRASGQRPRRGRVKQSPPQDVMPGATTEDAEAGGLDDDPWAIDRPTDQQAAPPDTVAEGADPPANEAEAEVEQARQAAAAERRRRRARNARTVESHNVWHIGADWCEAFAPAVFGPVEERLRAEALRERQRLDAELAAGLVPDRPQVLLLDDIPVYGRAQGGTARRDEGYFLLVAGEVTWGEAPQDPSTIPDRRVRLRLVRAMPKSNAPAWRLLLHELGYHPDFVVADAGTGIALAIGRHFDPQRTTFVPSLWHVGQAVRTALSKTSGALVDGPTGRELPDELREHLAGLNRDDALWDVAAWGGWWDGLEACCVALRLPLDQVRRRRRLYEPQFAAALPRLQLHREVPVSTGGLETVMRRQVKPLLALRGSAFANIERTNRLLDLVIAREHGAFDDIPAVAATLRADAVSVVGAHSRRRGWAPPLRSICDPSPEEGRYSSLRDPLLVLELAEERKLT